jgi:16S rRNA (adenine1518-N6/adenine1519-N6)-dimethyltransferase
MLERAQHVTAIEVDRELVEFLRTRFAGEQRLEVLHADILQVDLGQWGCTAVAGNLPYYITSPILARLVTYRAAVRQAVLLVQREVAERMAARPGSRDYGFLTVQLSVYFDVTPLFDVKPGAFRPPPKVDSTVVRLVPNRRAEELGVGEAFLRFSATCFRQKRKTIRNNLTSEFGRERLEGVPEANRRAEELTLEELASLYRRLIASDPGG